MWLLNESDAPSSVCGRRYYLKSGREARRDASGVARVFTDQLETCTKRHDALCFVQNKAYWERENSFERGGLRFDSKLWATLCDPSVLRGESCPSFSLFLDFRWLHSLRERGLRERERERRPATWGHWVFQNAFSFQFLSRLGRLFLEKSDHDAGAGLSAPRTRPSETRALTRDCDSVVGKKTPRWEF